MSDPSNAEGRLIVTRDDPGDIQMRDLYVRIDDRPMDVLQFGEKLDLSLPIGPHLLKVTNKLFSKTETFEIDTDQTVQFSAANIWMKGVLSPLLVITGTGAYRVDLKRV